MSFNVCVIIYTFFIIYVNCKINLSHAPEKYQPTKGRVWPKPQNETILESYYTFNPSKFKVKVTHENCPILKSAVERYSYILKTKNSRTVLDRKIILGSKARRYANDSLGLHLGPLSTLEIQLTSPCEEYPYYEMNESYLLYIHATSLLTSVSVWGIMRGLETFVQKFYVTDDMDEIRINASYVHDFPRYLHRGLMLDTSRHYISVSKILITLEAMTMNKMNVFHWHIVDDQSFPYQSEIFPDLSLFGAYHSSMVYTKEDILRVVEFARVRGIRVIPEFDMPGHSRSWGHAYPNILTECYRRDEVVGLGPMNPVRNVTYKLIRDLFKEVQIWFPDKYFHIGGDEVDMRCWLTNPEVREYMRNSTVSEKDLYAIFIRNIVGLLANDTKVIVWQDVFDESVPLPKETLVHVWKILYIKEMIKVLEEGHRVLFSSSWYLDRLATEWFDLYKVDPKKMVRSAMVNDELLEGIVGGEACMWSEMVDDTNVISRVWPRASAVAERLWSPEDISQEANLYVQLPIPEETYHRLEEHVCRMNRRGIAAQPATGAGFCLP